MGQAGRQTGRQVGGRTGAQPPPRDDRILRGTDKRAANCLIGICQKKKASLTRASGRGLAELLAFSGAEPGQHQEFFHA